MRWKSKFPGNPHESDTVISTKFAFIPCKTDDHRWVWMERYLAKYQYSLEYSWLLNKRIFRWEIFRKFSKDSEEWSNHIIANSGNGIDKEFVKQTIKELNDE